MAGEAGVQGAEKELPNPPAPFERGQLVWAKLAGFPWWPSRVRRLEQVPAAGSGEVAGGAASWQARVRFCGTTFGDSRDFATIGCAGTMFSFQEKADEWAAKMPYAGKSKVIRKQWKKAVDEARASPAIDLSPDEEERAEAEAAAEHAAEAAAAAEAEAAVWAAGWSTSGHELVGARVARRFQGIEGNRPFLGTITRWLPPDAPAQDASIPAGGADGSKTNVGAPPERPSAEVSSTLAINGSTVVLMYKSTDGSVDASMETSVDTSAPPGADAASAGVGAAARGCAGVVPAVPAKVVGDDEVLFHVVMDDGDEEDLEQYELDAALALWRSTAEGIRTLRTEAIAADREWLLLERAARSAARKARGHDGVEPPMAAWEIYRRHVEALMGEGCEGAGVTEVHAFLLEEYHALTDTERLPFERRAARDRLRCDRERRLKRKRAAREKKLEKERAAAAGGAEEAGAGVAGATEGEAVGVAGGAAEGEAGGKAVRAAAEPAESGGKSVSCHPAATPPAFPLTAAPADKAEGDKGARAATPCGTQGPAPVRIGTVAGAASAVGEARAAAREGKAAVGSEENPPVNLQRVGGAGGKQSPAKKMRVGC